MEKKGFDRKLVEPKKSIPIRTGLEPEDFSKASPGEPPSREPLMIHLPGNRNFILKLQHPWGP